MDLKRSELECKILVNVSDRWHQKRTKYVMSCLGIKQPPRNNEIQIYQKPVKRVGFLSEYNGDMWARNSKVNKAM